MEDSLSQYPTHNNSNGSGSSGKGNRTSGKSGNSSGSGSGSGSGLLRNSNSISSDLASVGTSGGGGVAGYHVIALDDMSYRPWPNPYYSQSPGPGSDASTGPESVPSHGASPSPGPNPSLGDISDTCPCVSPTQSDLTTFASCAAAATAIPDHRLSTPQKLSIYGLYKQSTMGDVSTSTKARPGIFDVTGGGSLSS